MTGLHAAVLTAAAVAVALPVLYVQIRRAMDRESVRDFLIRAAHELADEAREIDQLERLYDLPAYDPAWEAGMERLWDAARDQQNQPEGGNP